jgi:hypothetical protein
VEQGNWYHRARVSHHELPRQLSRPVIAALLLGALSTCGDWVWSRYIPDGAVIPGVVHGMLVFFVLALVLGGAAGTRAAVVRLALSLPLAGLIIAAAFYPLARLTGYAGALLVTWVAMWLTLAVLQRWAHDVEFLGAALLRGAVGAVGSGLGFWAISGIWTAPDPQPNYLLRFLLWSFAFLPGFLGLLLGRRTGPP